MFSDVIIFPNKREAILQVEQFGELPVHATPGMNEDAFGNRSRSHQPEIVSENRSHYRVLIVEDEMLIAENLRYVLEDKGYEVVGIAASGEDAVFQAGEKCPDLILMDIRIEGEFDGIEAARRIRNLHREDMPVVFLSAYASNQFPHLNELEAESFRYVRKPYVPRELVGIIHGMLTRH